jgi:tripartite-type tricarboxylate transporter receptor subunit TctC
MNRLLLALLSVACAGVAAAQSYPSKPIRLVITYPPGGATDVVGRALAAKLGESLGQQVVVDNRGGAGGIIGTDVIAHAPADGYSILLGTSAGMSINPLLHKKMPYDPNRDFAPISLVVINPQALVAHPGLPVKDVAGLIKLAKKRPGEINYASPGVGSPNHMGMELLKSMTGINVVHVPYKGGGPAMTDLLSGQVQLLFNSIPSVLPQIRAGRLKVLAVSSSKRSSAMPDVPAVAETVPGYEYVTWYGLFAPRGTPAAIVDKLAKTTAAALKSPDLSRSLRNQGSEPTPSTPDELQRFVQKEHDRWAHVVKIAHIQAE